MKITVIGCGRWGTFIASYLSNIGCEVTLYGRASSENMQHLLCRRRNDFLALPESLALSTDIGCAASADTVVVSVSSQNLRGLLRELPPCENKTFVLCMKGLEYPGGLRLSEVAAQELPPSNAVAVWLGPGHVQDFMRGVPNCMVIDSENEEVKARLIKAFSSSLIRFYYGGDLIGNELGAAAKNVIGIAAGILDALGLSNLKGALMSRGTLEIGRLIAAMGGLERSAYGLCHLGDYEATLFSPFSRNRRFGEALVKNAAPPGELPLAEGSSTVPALCQLGERYGAQLPICRAVYDIIYCGADPRETLLSLFERTLKAEF